MLDMARAVLSDCIRAHALLDSDSDPEVFRIHWVASVALSRAVGHVLQKVDGRGTPAVAGAVSAAYERWKTDSPGNAIFWEFIDDERNRVLKQYEHGFFADPVPVAVGDEHHVLGDYLFCPITDGAYAGEDCRDVLAAAIPWWTQELEAIEREVQRYC